MFGKDQQKIVNEEDVGAYVAELEKQGKSELNNFIIGEEDGVENTCNESPDGSQDT